MICDYCNNYVHDTMAIIGKYENKEFKFCLPICRSQFEIYKVGITMEKKNLCCGNLVTAKTETDTVCRNCGLEFNQLWFDFHLPETQVRPNITTKYSRISQTLDI